jgi:hypothetical protein
MALLNLGSLLPYQNDTRYTYIELAGRRRIPGIDRKGHAMNDPTGHTCLLQFDTDDAEFVRGFEAGRLWALLRATDDEVVECIHASNAEMAMRLAEATDRSVGATELENDWLEATFSTPETV